MPEDVEFSMATSEQLEKMLCKRIERIRLSRNITQQMLANEAGVSLRTVTRMAKGEGISLDTFIRLLMALDIKENLKDLLPDPSIRPIERIGDRRSERKRARPIGSEKGDRKWSWGDL